MPAAPAVSIRAAAIPADVQAVRELFVEYQQALGISLCFQGFDEELAGLPGCYAPPRGVLLLATISGEPAGCVGLRPHSARDAEMKRLYVRARFRRTGLGGVLARRAIEWARTLDYRHVLLDTLPAMREAQALYASLGFRDCAPYNDNPIEGVRFLALDL